ncbi:single-stranded DNA-binding protein [Thermosynechococcaceae cyanobacterium BACA0444]|uniref:Single-stranded DNA-binding protein n=1 Tax=Pseudocalidococcus azoricus BACA0444 TaxID=2918990 RepID=A0AAE4JXV9_9CYAN|nr:single-stranded DNA-binding protein [Pseudocalidococcus azoricus]MDS3860294.1 single-stranded DNA-binding protein [Pseudocalidococcus azoricus BACA0444]
MNSCVLMAEIIEPPELRYTQDNQTPIATMIVQFPGQRAEDPPETLKVIGWGNLAQQMQDQCKLQDRLLIEGRLNMNTWERPEGFKEKRAELTASKIHWLTGDGQIVTRQAEPASLTSKPASAVTPVSPSPVAAAAPARSSAPVPPPPATATRPLVEPDLPPDDLPF